MIIRKGTQADLVSVEQLYNDIHTAEETGHQTIGWIRGGVLYLEVVLRPVQLLLLERAGSDQLAAGNLECKILRVYRTETAQTDDANFDFLHVCSPFYRADFLSTAIERLPVSLSY